MDGSVFLIVVGLFVAVIVVAGRCDDLGTAPAIQRWIGSSPAGR